MRLKLCAPMCLVFLFASSIPVRAASRLIFPRILFQQGRSAGIAIANPSDGRAHITLKLYQSDGNLFSGPGVSNPVERDIASGQQFAEQADQLFKPPANILGGVNPTRLWMEVASATDGLTGFFLDYNNTLDYLDGSDLGNPGINLVLPLVENTGGNRTEISIVNPQETGASIELEFIDSDGKALFSKSASIAKKGALQGQLSELYPGDYTRVVAMRVRSDRPVLCFGYLLSAGDKSLRTLSAQSASGGAKTLYFPQLAEGAQWSTFVGLVNFASSEVLVTISAQKPDGSLFSPPEVKENPVVRKIAAGGVLRASATSLFGFAASPLQQGWLKAETNRPDLYGYVEYGYGTGTDRALVSAQLDATTKAVFSHQAMGAPFFTGVAVLNTSALAANVEVVSLKPNGDIWGKAQRVLKPGQRESLLVQQWVAAASGNGGSVIVKSDNPIIATELFGTASVLANVPPQKVTTTFDPGAKLPSIKVKPALYALETGKPLKFTAEGAAGLVWHVNDIKGGKTDVGTIADDGTYKAPAISPKEHTITVTARTPQGDQSGGASVNLIQRESLVTGLTQVTSVAYFENLQRFFIAEQQILSSPAKSSRVAASTPGSRILEQRKPPDTGRDVFLEIPNDVIGKMVPFTDAKGGNYMLIAGKSTGKIYRLNLADKKIVTVYQGLNQPNSLALDEKTGNLIVCEDDKVTVVPRASFDPSLSAADLAYLAATQPRAPRSIALPGARGVALDKCSDAVYIVTQDGVLHEYQGNRSTPIYNELRSPNEILALYLEGATSCEESFVLLITGADSVTVVYLAEQLALEFVSDVNLPRDLEFFPANSPFIPGGEASVGIAEENGISEVGIGGLFGEEDPITDESADFVPTAFPYEDPEGDTFETAASKSNLLDVPDIIAVDALASADSVVLAIVFSGTVSEYDYKFRDSLQGFIDFDVDANPQTGVQSIVDDYSPFGVTGLGVDAYVDLSKMTFVNSAYPQGIAIDYIFLDDVVLLEIPAALANLSKARLALVVGNLAEATDTAPNEGYLDLATAEVFAAAKAGLAAAGMNTEAKPSYRLPRPPRRPRVKG